MIVIENIEQISKLGGGENVQTLFSMIGKNAFNLALNAHLNHTVEELFKKIEEAMPKGAPILIDSKIYTKEGMPDDLDKIMQSIVHYSRMYLQPQFNNCNFMCRYIWCIFDEKKGKHVQYDLVLTMAPAKSSLVRHGSLRLVQHENSKKYKTKKHKIFTKYGMPHLFNPLRLSPKKKNKTPKQTRTVTSICNFTIDEGVIAVFVPLEPYYSLFKSELENKGPEMTHYKQASAGITDETLDSQELKTVLIAIFKDFSPLNEQSEFTLPHRQIFEEYCALHKIETNPFTQNPKIGAMTIDYFNNNWTRYIKK